MEQPGVFVAGVSTEGITVSLNSKVLFLDFDKLPRLADAPVKKILNVETPSPGHLFWPDLDVDLSTEIIMNPENYPLVSGVSAREPV